MRTLRNSIPSLVVIGLAVAVVAVVGGSFGTDLWYRRLMKPALNPPDWIFGPVWTILYILMIVAAWTIWRTETYRRSKVLALGIFAGQLVLNAAWSWLFFGLHEPGWALVDILLLDLAVALMILRFWQVSRLAGLLMVPYLLWILFATYLNWAILQLN